MSKQNPTAKDSEEYKKLKANCIQWQKEAMAARDLKVEDSEEYKAVVDNWIDTALCLERANLLLKQFHYGPVTEEYKERVKRYIEEEGL